MWVRERLQHGKGRVAEMVVSLAGSAKLLGIAVELLVFGLVFHPN